MENRTQLTWAYCATSLLFTSIIEFQDGRLLVVDHAKNQVQELSNDRMSTKIFAGAEGAGSHLDPEDPTQTILFLPVGLHLFPNGDVLIHDNGNDRFVLVSADCRRVESIEPDSLIMGESESLEEKQKVTNETRTKKRKFRSFLTNKERVAGIAKIFRYLGWHVDVCSQVMLADYIDLSMPMLTLIEIFASKLGTKTMNNTVLEIAPSGYHRIRDII